MDYLFPLSFQKRILRFVLSKLDILDVEALEETLKETPWGSIELRNVTLRLEKYLSLLHLPDYLRISKAKVLLLRITLPSFRNILSDGILVEIEGLRVEATADQLKTSTASKEHGRRGLGRGVKANQPRSTEPRKHDPGGISRGRHGFGGDHEDDGPARLPTTDDLAQSFLEVEPVQEDLGIPHANQGNEEDTEVTGLGTGMGLQKHIAGFLKGVADRLKVVVKTVHVDVSLSLELPVTSTVSAAPPTSPETVTFRLSIDQIHVGRVQSEIPSEGSPKNHGSTEPPIIIGSRQVTLSNIQGLLISDATIFSQMTTPPSPTAKHTRTPLHSSTVTLAGPIDRTSSSFMSQSASSNPSISSDPSIDQREGPSPLANSLVSSTDARSSEPREGYESESSSFFFNNDQYESEPIISRYEDYESLERSYAHEAQTTMSSQSIEDSDTLPQALTGSHISRGSDDYHFADEAVVEPTPPSDQASLHASTLRIQPRSISQGFHSLTSDDEDADTESKSIFQSMLSPTEESLNEEAPTEESPTEGVPPTYLELPTSETPIASPPSFPLEDLTRSRIWSHDEAQSMYMSAMSELSKSRNEKFPVPGGWEVESMTSEEHVGDSTEERKEHDIGARDEEEAVPSMSLGDLTPDAKSTRFVHGDGKKALYNLGADDPDHRNIHRSGQTAANTSKMPHISKRFLHIRTITVRISVPGSALESAMTNPINPIRGRRVSNSSGFPDGFSLYDESTPDIAARPQNTGVEHDQNQDCTRKEKENGPSISIRMDKAKLINDMAFTRLMVMILEHVSSLKPTATVLQQPISSPKPSMPVSIHVDDLSWKFVDVLKGYVVIGPDNDIVAPEVSHPHAEILLEARISALTVSQKIQGSSSVTELSIGSYTFGYSDEPIITFDSSLKMRESVRDFLAPVNHDVEIDIHQCPGLAPKIMVRTLPIHIALDLTRLDETFSWFGGLSSMLGLGGSMLSSVTITEPKIKSPTHPKPARVRFEAPGDVSTPNDTTESASSQPKVTARVGGIFFKVQGKGSSFNLEGTALKLVSRAAGIRTRIDKLRFTGPLLRDNKTDPAVSANLGSVSVDYLPAPRERDLARLLALLSPSRERNDDDDDILLDTLLRQRRKGAILRLEVAKIKGSLHQMHELEHVNLLIEELKKLSTVTKYLPEDDRPGAMVLAMIAEATFDIHVNSQLGNVAVGTRNIEIAAVTLPSLLLLGIDSLNVHHGDELLVGEVLPQVRDVRSTEPSDPDQASPMIMAKMIGDEMEPTLKVKLSNIRFEYHVSTIMSILGITESATGEILVSEMAESVATMTELQFPPKLSSQTSAGSGESSAKQLRFSITVRDSVLGLNPRGSPAKGLIVLVRTTVSGSFPRHEESELCGLLEIKKAALMIVDDIKNIVPYQQPATVTAPYSITKQDSCVQDLVSMGWVSVSDISSARVDLHVSSKGEDGAREIEVDIRDDLFVLETCADSAQTLQAVFSGLQPPMPPSKELRYRTEVVPVEDMLASFTGDAFDTGDLEGHPLDLDEGDMVDDDVPQNLEFINSFYDPNGTAKSESLANSMLLCEDFESVSNPPKARYIGAKQMMQSFQERCQIDPGSDTLNFDEEHFGTSSIASRANRWSSDQNAYEPVNRSSFKRSPFRLRIRDAHIIWNLFDGYDWQRTRDTISKAVTELEIRATERQARRDRRKSLDAEEEEDSVIGDFLFNSIYIGVGANHDPRDLARQVNRNLADDLMSEADSYAAPTTVSASPSRQGHVPRIKKRRLRLHRSKHHKMTFELKGVSADFVIFPQGSGETQSSLDLRITDLDVFDHVPTSTWKKFATYMHDAGDRESGTSMLHIELLNVRPVPDLAASELVLRATVLPLRLHVDQDALDFLTRFFEFKEDSGPSRPSSGSEPPFLQRVEINAIPVKLDFKPKRVDYAGLRSGHTTEFMNFFILDGADMVMRHAIIYGVSGFDKLGKTLNDIWMPDIKNNQLPGVLAGLAPIRSLANVGAGVRDLVVVPMREYRKDGRVMRAVQKGALTFAKTTTTELAKLGAKLAIGTQNVLQNAEDLLAPSDAARADEFDEGERTQMLSPYADMPIGVVQGLRGAYRHLERDLLLARDAIVAMPGEIMESGSAAGAARAVLKGAPTVILRPALGVSKAVGQTLGGLTNTLDRKERRRADDKYKRH